MRKFLSLIACVSLAFAALADVSKVYVNPMQNQANNVDKTIANRLFKKGMLGLTKAKTISVASGDYIKPGTDAAAKYDYIMDITLSKATIEEAGTLNNLGNAVGGLLGKKSTSEPDWNGKLFVDVVLYTSVGATPVFQTTLTPNSTNKDKSVLFFNATENFDYDMTDMTDDAFRVSGEVIEPVEVDKKGIVKKVRAGIGTTNGARKNQAFELYKVVGDNKELIGAAKCERVLSNGESILSINGKKDADKVVSELIQNNDGSYTIEAWSRSRTGFTHENFQGIDKMFTKDGRPNYMDPFGRTSKPKVAFLDVAINDPKFSAQKDAFVKRVLDGMREVTTVELESKIYPSVEAASKAGIDGLVEITVDKIDNTTEKDKEGKTVYKTKIYYTVGGIDAVNNRWIEMKSYTGVGDSKEGTNKANADALGLMDTYIKKFCEDVFPVAASIVDATEVDAKKGVAKKVRIDQGTNMGIKKGMHLDIYEQRAEGGEDSRHLLGEATVEKDGLAATEAIVKVKGKDGGEKKLYELLQNADENTKIVLISKCHDNIFQKGLNFLSK